MYLIEFILLNPFKSPFLLLTCVILSYGTAPFSHLRLRTYLWLGFSLFCWFLFSFPRLPRVGSVGDSGPIGTSRVPFFFPDRHDPVNFKTSSDTCFLSLPFEYRVIIHENVECYHCHLLLLLWQNLCSCEIVISLLPLNLRVECGLTELFREK